MPHTFNRSAFEAGRVAGNPLLALYTSLVIIELALKDRKPQWEAGHRVQQLLNELNDAGITALTYQLATQLQTLVCTARDGNDAVVAADKYPDLRYLRHELDFPGKSTDANIVKSVEIVDDIRIQLKNQGIIL